jgi:hypothetical protein
LLNLTPDRVAKLPDARRATRSNEVLIRHWIQRIREAGLGVQAAPEYTAGSPNGRPMRPWQPSAGS